jgi:hypothetical protein
MANANLWLVPRLKKTARTLRSEPHSFEGDANGRNLHYEQRQRTSRQIGPAHFGSGAVLVELQILLLCISTADHCATGDPQHICRDPTVSHDGLFLGSGGAIQVEFERIKEWALHYRRGRTGG